jgi:hypothetical protein
LKYRRKLIYSMVALTAATTMYYLYYKWNEIVELA